MLNNKVIIVFCHSRAKLLDKCLISLKKASGIDSWKVGVVFQRGHKDVALIIDKHRSFIDNLIVTKPNFDFPLGNINYNRILGTKFAFEIQQAEYMLGIEEDNVISADSLNFIDFVYDKYRTNPAFRGINLGSIEHGENVSENTYSLLRSGLHGSAGVLTYRTWKSIQRKNLMNFDLSNKKFAWDAKIEFYLKGGFMVTPNLSRNLDLGYGGTFAPASKNDPYFIEIKKSWYRSKPLLEIEYKHLQIDHRIRKDAVGYKKAHSIFYLLRSNNLIYNASNIFRLKNVIKNKLIPDF